MYTRLVDILRHAAGTVLPPRAVQQRRPWISERTLAFVEQRYDARRNKQLDDEQLLAKSKRKSVALDRSIWLDSLVESGS